MSFICHTSSFMCNEFRNKFDQGMEREIGCYRLLQEWCYEVKSWGRPNLQKSRKGKSPEKRYENETKNPLILSLILTACQDKDLTEPINNQI